jgi:hypothetical protein
VNVDRKPRRVAADADCADDLSINENRHSSLERCGIRERQGRDTTALRFVPPLIACDGEGNGFSTRRLSASHVHLGLRRVRLHRAQGDEADDDNEGGYR